MTRNKILCAAMCLVISVIIVPSAYAQDGPVVIRAWTIGPGPVPITRATNLETAAERLNESGQLAQEVIVEATFSELKWGPFMEQFYTACEAGEGPQIVTSKDIPQLADGGFLVPLDEHVEAGWDQGYSDIYTSLWDAVRYTPQEGPYAGESHVWGIPQDATPGGVWFRRDVLRELGYGDEDIAQMLPPTAEGVTMDDLARLAQEAQEAGLVEWGILHRPSAGDTILIYMHSFGGRVYDAETNSLVLNRDATQRFFEWFGAQVDAGVIPPAPPEWAVTHSTFVEAQALFTFASHVGTPSEWMSSYDLAQETFENDLGFMLFPPADAEGEPITTLGPLAYLVTQGCVAPEEENPEIAAALLLEATASDLVVRHTVQTMRPPIRRAALDHEDLEDYEFAAYMRDAASMLEFAQDVPSHPAWGIYKSSVFEVLKAVEADLLSPEDAVEELVTVLQADIPDIVIE